MGEWEGYLCHSRINQMNIITYLKNTIKMSNEELAEIAKPESGYTELAVKVASDILRSDSITKI